MALREENKEEQKKPADQQSNVAALIEDARKQGKTTLDLSGQELTELPESLGQLTQLQKQKQVTSYNKLNAFVRYPAWPPAGDKIVYEYTETTGNVWLMELK